MARSSFRRSVGGMGFEVRSVVEGLGDDSDADG